ncbi:MAG: transposase zinc-binding domain-containing protein, partial [Chloroflexi bacterium]|nr:transposase zinc-binding domain-containing protein [Chloroflexota bacterium]
MPDSRDGRSRHLCDAREQSYYSHDSCRNRHCPQCQGDKADGWPAGGDAAAHAPTSCDLYPPGRTSATDLQPSGICSTIC